MASAAELALKISATDTTGGVLDKVGKQAGGLGSALGGVAKIAAGVGAAFMGMKVIQGVFGGIIDGAMESERVMAATNAVIASTKGVAGMSAGAVSELAGSLSKLTAFDDEVIQSAENMLLTFTNIGKDVFPMATETVLNMSEALGQDAKSSAMQLGKALNDPIAGVAALQRVGVKLTDQQLEMVKSFMAVGDVAGAQKVILGELETEFGGAAKAAGGTMAGQMKILETQIGNVKETIGAALLPILSSLLQKLMPLVTAFGDWLPGALAGFGDAVGQAQGVAQPFIDAISQIVGAISELIGTGDIGLFADNLREAFGIDISSFVGAIQSVLDTLGQLPDIGEKLLGVFTGVGGAGLDLHNTLEGLVGLDVANWIIGIVEKFQGLIEGIGKAVGEILPMVGPAFENIKNIITTVMGFILGVIKDHWGQIQGVIDGVITVIQGIIEIGLSIVKGIIKTVLSLIAGDWEGAWNSIQEMLSGVWEGIKKVIGGALEIVKGILSLAWDAIKAVAQAAWDGFKALIQAVWDALVSWVTETLEGLKTALSTAWETIKTTAQTAWDLWREGIVIIWNALITKIDEIIEGLKTALSTAWETIKTTAETVWELWKKGIVIIWEALTTKIDKIIKGLKTALSTAWETIKTTAETVWEMWKKGIVIIWEALTTKIDEILEGLKTALSTAWDEIKETATTVWQALETVVKTVWDNMWSKIKEVAGWIGTKIDEVKGWIDGLIGMWERLKEIIRGVLGLAAPPAPPTGAGAQGIGALGIATSAKTMEEGLRGALDMFAGIGKSGEAGLFSKAIDGIILDIDRLSKAFELNLAVILNWAQKVIAAIEGVARAMKIITPTVIGSQIPLAALPSGGGGQVAAAGGGDTIVLQVDLGGQRLGDIVLTGVRANVQRGRMSATVLV